MITQEQLKQIMQKLSPGIVDKDHGRYILSKVKSFSSLVDLKKNWDTILQAVDARRVRCSYAAISCTQGEKVNCPHNKSHYCSEGENFCSAVMANVRCE